MTLSALVPKAVDKTSLQAMVYHCLKMGCDYIVVQYSNCSEYSIVHRNHVSSYADAEVMCDPLFDFP